MEEIRIKYKNSRGRRPLEKPTMQWECDIKSDVKKICFEDIKWIELARDCVQSRERDTGLSGLLKS
jgi:hypothetical protein